MLHLRRWSLSVVLALGLGAVLAPAAWSDHLDDHGTIVGGVSSESEAVAYPCPKTPGGSYATTGPVVCVAKRASVWSLTWENNGYSCSYGAAGWSGNCIFDNDMGDYIKVWGTRGIPDTRFTVRWGHASVDPEEEPAPGGGAGPPSGGGSGGTTGGDTSGGPGSRPTAPTRPTAPGAPGAPGYSPSPGTPAPGAPDAPSGPDGIEAPDLAAPGERDSGGDAGSTEATAGAGDDEDDGAPWAPIAAGLLIAGAAATAVVLSRRRG